MIFLLQIGQLVNCKRTYLPGIKRRTVALPFEEVLGFAVSYSSVQDSLDDVFLVEVVLFDVLWHCTIES